MTTILRPLLLLSLAPVSLSAGTWSQYRGPQTNGVTAEAITAPKSLESASALQWKVPINTGFSSFVAGEGKVFTLVRREIDGIDCETLVALDQATGKEAWAQALSPVKFNGGGDSGADNNKGGDGPRATPAVDGGLVYTIDAELVVSCMDAATGKPVWKHNVMKEYGGRNITWSNAASPLILGDHLFMAGGGKGQSFLAFSKKTGELAWATGDEGMTHATPVAATIHGVEQILFFTQKGLTALAPSDGKELWHADFPYKTSTAASPVVFEDIVYCSAGYGVGAGAFQIKKTEEGFTAEELWRKPNKMMNHWSSPLCKDGYLYGIFGFKEYGSAPLACYDIRTGDLKWEQEGFGPGNVILAGDQLLALGDMGQLVVVNASPTKYEEAARVDVLDGKCWTTPILADGRIYARSTKEGVCLALK